MVELWNDARREHLLTARWNNILMLALGLPALVFAVVALTTDSFSDRAAFFGLVVASSFY